MGIWIVKLLQLGGVASNKFGGVIKRTPMVGRIHEWTEKKASINRHALWLLGGVISIAAFMMVYILRWVFKLILLGKLDAVAAGVIGGAFTLLGGVLAITIPAFISALNALNETPGTHPPAPPPPAAPGGNSVGE